MVSHVLWVVLSVILSPFWSTIVRAWAECDIASERKKKKRRWTREKEHEPYLWYRSTLTSQHWHLPLPKYIVNTYKHFPINATCT